MKTGSEFSNTSVNLLVESILPVFQHYYKGCHRTFIRASDYYIPFFFGKKKRTEEFNSHYIPLCVALLLEAVGTVTAKRYGHPLTEVMDKLKERLLSSTYNFDFEQYWNFLLAQYADGSKPEERKCVEGLTSLFMNQLFGPESEYPNPDYIQSERHRMAVDFQIGSFMYSLVHGIEKVMDRLQGEGKIPPSKPSPQGADKKKQVPK